MSGTASTVSDPSIGDLVIDLNDPEEGYSEAYQPERIVAWLRSSGGSLGERAMKCAAADLIEADRRDH